jgi:hypothetical protein
MGKKNQRLAISANKPLVVIFIVLLAVISYLQLPYIVFSVLFNNSETRFQCLEKRTITNESGRKDKKIQRMRQFIDLPLFV